MNVSRLLGVRLENPLLLLDEQHEEELSQSRRRLDQCPCVHLRREGANLNEKRE